MNQILDTEEGFTGLEAAIVLIAFVVVAATFSYVVLGAGFFTTQKSQEVVYTSVDMASSNLEVIGDVYGLNGTSTTNASKVQLVRFTVGLSAGGSPVDFNSVQMVWATENTVEILDNVSGTDIDAATDWGEWNITDGAADTDLLLEYQDKFTIVAQPSAVLSANEEFNLEIRPSVGAAFGLKRTIPAKINSVNLLY